MIQRIQSLYLLAGVVLSVAVMFSGIFYIGDGSSSVVLGAFGVTEGNLIIKTLPMIPIAILSGMNIVLLGFAISQFKNRKLQSTLAKVGAFLAVLIIGWLGYVYYELLQMELTLIPFVGVFHAPMVLFACILAIRGINKDEAIVKSVDRIR